jgi:nifR3 family TIM-barrel protein
MAAPENIAFGHSTSLTARGRQNNVSAFHAVVSSRVARWPRASANERRRDREPSFFVFGPDNKPPAPLNAPPLKLGPLTIDPPIVLAPMAGVTNYPFRRLCAEHGAALYISEMVLARNVAEGRPDGRARFGPDESPRSAQLYGTDPGVMRAAAERLILDQEVQHIDLNFGCPVQKVLRNGGGAAVPANPPLLRSIVAAVVDVARGYDVPVTAKIRLGVDWLNLNYLEAGQIIEDCGAAAITLHARTAADLYTEGAARRSYIHIAALQNALKIPVLGNGDVFSAADALRMMRSTLASGVVIGRGCLGRPWLFGDLVTAFRLRWASEVTIPSFNIVADTMMAHLEDSVAWQIVDGVDEAAAVKSMRKWFGWYWHGYNGLPPLWVPRMCKETTVDGIRQIVAEADPENVSYDYNIVVGNRGKYTVPKTPNKEPLAPVKPKKSASQRLPKSEEGLARRQAKIDATWATYQAEKDRLVAWRQKRTRPRRRAHAETVQRELAKQGTKQGGKAHIERKDDNTDDVNEDRLGDDESDRYRRTDEPPNHEF